MTAVILIQGGGDGAFDEDAALAASLREHLGEEYAVDFPRMPNEGDPDPGRWGAAIDDAIARADEPLVLVGHSAGGYVLVRHLAEHPPSRSIAALCVIAAPFPDADPSWSFEGFDLPDDLAGRLPEVPIFLYASEDDEIVPFAHRASYAAALPTAVERTTTGGHQLGGDLRVVADDIRSVIAG